jgi:hypothetical protein
MPRISLCSLFFIVLSTSLNTTTVLASHPDRAYEEKLTTGFFLERARYEEYVYSRGRKTELGDQVEIDVALRYQHDERSYARIRFETDPIENRFDNKTNRFEIVGGHFYNNFAIRVDSEINTNDDGGQSIGLDLDSRGTYLAYQKEQGLGFIFFPFNFDSQVGREFNTWDVTRLYFIDGSPTLVNNTQLASEKIAVKTIPGIEINVRPDGYRGWKAYVGFGMATYLYPVNPNYNIQTNRAADRWERKEVAGYKFGLTYRGASLKDPTIFNFQFSSHDKTEETGSLLAQAGSVNARFFIDDLFLDGEITYSRAGKAPFRLSRSGEWFEQTSPFQPVYSDFFGRPMDFINQEDFALALKVGHRFQGMLPYAFFRWQGKHFIYRERESAHQLRTADESASHGGLTRMGLGFFQQYGKFTINPEFEYLKAKNPVFGNSGDVRSDRVLSSFRKQDFLLYLTVTYYYDGSMFRTY